MKKLSSFLPVVALGTLLLGAGLPLAAQTILAPSPTPATGTLPSPTPTTSGSVPAPTPTPGAPVLPSAETLRAQGAIVSQVRRLVRDVQSNTDNIKAINNFGAQLYLVGDETFFQDWRKPEIPTITPVSLTVRNQPLYTAVIFYGPARDDKGLCNVSYDITVKRPDGSLFAERKSMIGWQNLAPDERQLMLGRNYLNIDLAPTDPSGIYTVEVLVHDNVGRVDLPLKQTFAVQ